MIYANLPLHFFIYLRNFYACVQNLDGVLKMKKLQKLVMKALEESGITDDETQLIKELESKVSLYFKWQF